MNVSVQFSRSVVSNSLQPHGLQPARPACPSPTPGACSDSCPSSRWCHPNNSSSVVPFSSCLQSFPASGQFFISGAQSIRASASASVLPINIQDWFPLGLTGWIIIESTKASFSLKGTSSNLLQQVCYPVGSSCQITKMHVFWEPCLLQKPRIYLFFS